MATKMSVSYRRNRDYTKQFDWTYNLNCDLYNCYTKTKENLAIGYMKRMKHNWDTIHPESSHLTDKNLRDQASRIIKNKIVMETEFAKDSNTSLNSQSDNDNIHNNETVNEIINLGNDKPTNINRKDIENNQTQETPEYKSLKEKLKPIFSETIDNFNSKNIEERIYLTRVNTRIQDTLLKCVNDLGKEYITSLNLPNYWDINVCLYSAAVTCLREMNQLRELTPPTKNKPKFPQWLTQLEESITYLRITIGQLTVIIKCKQTNTFSKHQKSLLEKFWKKFRNTTMPNLQSKLYISKQKLKAKSEKLKYHKKLFERKSIKHRFNCDPKSVYRTMKGNCITTEKIPTKNEIETFWKSIWQDTNKIFNETASWLRELELTYCSEVESNQYQITRDTLKTAVNKIHLGKSPGRDLIIGYWFKKLTFYIEPLANLYQNTFEGLTTLPDWLTLAKTILLPKNEHTQAAKNSRPFACLNLTYKLYTSCLNNFLEHHCRINNIITVEQAGGKKGIWGTTEQLLINKIILKEAKTLKRNIYTVWLDYQKAFDSVTHEWLLRSLKLAKVPPQLISAIEKLTKHWATIASLHGTNETITTEIIKYLNGIFQGDTLSVLLFVLCLNPLSFLLQKLKGYSCGKSRVYTLTHNFLSMTLNFMHHQSASSKNN